MSLVDGEFVPVTTMDREEMEVAIDRWQLLYHTLHRYAILTVWLIRLTPDGVHDV